MTIDELKAMHKKDLDRYSESIRDHVDRYGAAQCDYLMHRQRMESYHRGAWNALNEYQRSVEAE